MFVGLIERKASGRGCAIRRAAAAASSPADADVLQCRNWV
jgi:hypothetical protein